MVNITVQIKNVSRVFVAKKININKIFAKDLRLRFLEINYNNSYIKDL